MAELEPILHIEDDEVVARAVERLLLQYGFRSTCVPSCREALGLETDARLGIFDIDLPDGDGVSLAARLLADGRVHRVVFYTGTSDRAALARARALGPVVTKGEGHEVLLSALGRRATSDGPVSGVEGPPSPKASAS